VGKLIAAARLIIRFHAYIERHSAGSTTFSNIFSEARQYPVPAVAFQEKGYRFGI
jgi:hypothetical protein